MPRTIDRLAAVALAATVSQPLGGLAAGRGEVPAIEPIVDQAAVAELTRDAEIVVTVTGKGELRVAGRAPGAGTPEPPRKVDDPAIRAVLSFLGLDRAERFAIVGVHNPRCVKICELVGGDWICRKVCS